MSASLDNLALCAFVSRAYYLAGRECGSPVTHAFEGALLCRDHFIYQSQAYAVCNSCHSAKYEDMRVYQTEHTCSVIDAGGDCMHFEDTQYCTCESDALVGLCQTCDEYRRIAEDSTHCHGCIEESEAEDRFLYDTYYSQ